MRSGTDKSSVWSAFHWAKVAPNPLRTAIDVAHAAAWGVQSGEAAVLGGLLVLTLGVTLALTAAAAAFSVALTLDVADGVEDVAAAAALTGALSCPVASRMPPITTRAANTTPATARTRCQRRRDGRPGPVC